MWRAWRLCLAILWSGATVAHDTLILESVVVAETPQHRVLIARIAAHTRWAKEPDRAAATAKARRAALDRFENEVDPHRELAPEERARRAASARKAYFAKLALKSAQARKAKRQ